MPRVFPLPDHSNQHRTLGNNDGPCRDCLGRDELVWLYYEDIVLPGQSLQTELHRPANNLTALAMG